jgi:hypothetical protein
MRTSPRLPSDAVIRPRHVAVRVVAGVLLLAFVYQLYVAATHPLGVLHHWGADSTIYLDAARRFIAGGSFYANWQFQPATDPALNGQYYPPIALLVFVPMSLLPAPAWWAVPVATIAYVAWRQCRTDWQRVALLAAVTLSITPFVAGNGTLWVAAAMVAGNRWGWPAAFIILKPTLAPWALVGFRSREWWIVMVALLLLSLLMLPMWFEWLRVLSAWPAASSYLPSVLSLELALLWLATRRPRRPGVEGVDAARLRVVHGGEGPEALDHDHDEAERREHQPHAARGEADPVDG